MPNYDAYLNSDEGGKQYIMRLMFQEHNMMKQTIQELAQELDDLKYRKGVPTELKVMGMRTKPPNNIA